MNRIEIHKNFNPNGCIDIAKAIDDTIKNYETRTINSALMELYCVKIECNEDTKEVEKLYKERTNKTCVQDL